MLLRNISLATPRRPTVARCTLESMKKSGASLTALGAAGHRAAHQVLEAGFVFADTLAVRILGPDAQRAIRDARTDPSRRPLRLFIAMRTRYAEDALADAYGRGVRQLVVLGAGLDTYAYRGTPGDLRIFEVDHPATQAWKRDLLAAAGIALPANLTFAAIDFEHHGLAAGLAEAGFDPLQATFFTWMGVVPYLSADAVFATLQFVAGLPNGAQIVFDYANPIDSLPDASRAASDELARRVAAAGEPLLTFFDTDALHVRLAAIGFRDIEDLGPAELASRFLPAVQGRRSSRGGHVLRASTM